MTRTTARFIVDVERIGVTSFQDTCKLVELAKRLGCGVRTVMHKKIMIAFPESDPGRLYRETFPESHSEKKFVVKADGSLAEAEIGA